MKLSIITINRNNATGLEKTIQSVVCQTFSDFEYIVIDGNSDDGSADIIKKNADKITYWVSEPDSGIYNAMNKGIRKAQGDYCLFLNSGDYLVCPKTLQFLFSETDGNADIYYGDRINTDNTYVKYAHDLTINHLIKGMISHQNSLIKRSLFITHGFYNESLKIAADWEFYLKELWIYKTVFIHIDTNIAVFDVNGIGLKGSELQKAEDDRVIKNVFNELADTIIEFRAYRLSPYGNIIDKWGTSKILEFVLKVYKHLLKMLRG
jgi:glycosyltransferase involved in cell wall biosynthesis